MIDGWHERGRIDRCSVSRVVLSPWYGEDRTVVVVTPAGLALSRDGGDTWETPERGVVGPFVEDLVWRDSPGPPGVLVASTPAGLFRSSDGGRTWEAGSVEGAIDPLPALDGGKTGDGLVLDRPVLSLVATQDGATRWAGLVSGGCAESNDGGQTWREVPVPDGTVVVDIRATGGRLVVRTVEGFVAESGDGGATWRAGPLPDHVHVHAVALSPEPGTALFATDNGVINEQSGTIRSLHDTAFGHLAVSPSDPQVLIVGAEREVVRSIDGGQTWISLDLPLTGDEEIVDLAVGDGPGGEPGGLIATATLTSGGRGAVWLGHGAAAWRRAIVHPEPAPTVRLAAVGGPRGLFAALGDSVYRPARIGAMLYSREVVDRNQSARLLQLAAARTAGDDVVLAALSTNGLLLSRDGGMSWSELPSPTGPPLTALAVRSCGEESEILAVGLGGRVLARRVS